MKLPERLKSRKLHIAVIGFISATIFFYTGMLPPAQWVSLVKWIFGVYSLGNIGEHVANNIKKQASEQDTAK